MTIEEFEPFFRDLCIPYIEEKSGSTVIDLRFNEDISLSGRVHTIILVVNKDGVEHVVTTNLRRTNIENKSHVTLYALGRAKEIVRTLKKKT